MAKRVQIAALEAGPYYTLPGNSAELSNENGELADTIFGQEFSSSESGIGSWSITSNALYKGFAGYIVSLKKSGTSTPFTDAAMSLVSGKTYQINTASQQIWDTTEDVVVEDNDVAVAASNIESIDYLNGRVTFAASYTPTGPITVSGSYFGTAEIAGSKSFTLTMTSDAIDSTDIPTAKANGGFKTFDPGLNTASFELSGIYKSTNGNIEALIAREPLVLEVNPDNNGKSVARGIFKYLSQGQSGDVGALEEETVTFNLSVPDVQLLQYPFTWTHAVDTTLNQGIRILLDAWLNKTKVWVKYLPDGTTGHTGQAVVTDMSLSGGLEAMNEFSVTLQGSGAVEATP
jgi:predicted secreted protein